MFVSFVSSQEARIPGLGACCSTRIKEISAWHTAQSPADEAAVCTHLCTQEHEQNTRTSTQCNLGFGSWVCSHVPSVRCCGGQRECCGSSARTPLSSCAPGPVPVLCHANVVQDFSIVDSRPSHTLAKRDVCNFPFLYTHSSDNVCLWKSKAGGSTETNQYAYLGSRFVWRCRPLVH